jgi:hypothetical protein
MLLRIKHRPDVDNMRNYPAEIIKELEELLLSGGAALPDPKRKDFYDLENLGCTFFVHISPNTAKVMLIATWLDPQSTTDHRRIGLGADQLEVAAAN